MSKETQADVKNIIGCTPCKSGHWTKRIDMPPHIVTSIYGIVGLISIKKATDNNNGFCMRYGVYTLHCFYPCIQARNFARYSIFLHNPLATCNV